MLNIVTVANIIFLIQLIIIKKQGIKFYTKEKRFNMKVQLISVIGLVICANLMGGTQLPQQYQGNYYEIKPVSGIGKDSCKNPSGQDNGPFVFDATDMSFSTWIGCSSKKLVSSNKDGITISYHCSAEDFDPWVSNFKFDKKGISEKGKLIYKRCK
jgi:hypothetical protein